jgi:hypothetical protein
MRSRRPRFVPLEHRGVLCPFLWQTRFSARHFSSLPVSHGYYPAAIISATMVSTFAKSRCPNLSLPMSPCVRPGFLCVRSPSCCSRRTPCSATRTRCARLIELPFARRLSAPFPRAFAVVLHGKPSHSAQRGRLCCARSLTHTRSKVCAQAAHIPWYQQRHCISGVLRACIMLLLLLRTVVLTARWSGLVWSGPGQARSRVMLELINQIRRVEWGTFLFLCVYALVHDALVSC